VDSVIWLHARSTKYRLRCSRDFVHTLTREDRLNENSGASGDLPDGAVRYDSEGHLEILEGASWVPLVRVSDVDQPAVFRYFLDRRPSLPDGMDDPDGSNRS
jgi:hypothetical protein